MRFNISAGTSVAFVFLITVTVSHAFIYWIPVWKTTTSVVRYQPDKGWFPVKYGGTGARFWKPRSFGPPITQRGHYFLGRPRRRKSHFLQRLSRPYLGARNYHPSRQHRPRSPRRRNFLRDYMYKLWKPLRKRGKKIRIAHQPRPHVPVHPQCRRRSHKCHVIPILNSPPIPKHPGYRYKVPPPRHFNFFLPKLLRQHRPPKHRPPGPQHHPPRLPPPPPPGPGHHHHPPPRPPPPPPHSAPQKRPPPPPPSFAPSYHPPPKRPPPPPRQLSPSHHHEPDEHPEKKIKQHFSPVNIFPHIQHSSYPKMLNTHLAEIGSFQKSLFSFPKFSSFPKFTGFEFQQPTIIQPKSGDGNFGFGAPKGFGSGSGFAQGKKGSGWGGWVW